MAMAGTCFNITPSSTFRTINTTAAAKTRAAISLKRIVSSLIQSRRLLQQRWSGNGAAAAVLTAEVVEEKEDGYDRRENEGVLGEGEEMGMEMEKDKEKKKTSRPCELYVCNLPSSADITDLVEMFKPYGTVFSVEISRSVMTDLSRGSGYITMVY